MTVIPAAVEIALPVPFRRTFTYEVPVGMRGHMVFGCRVLVPFRKQRLVGVITALHEKLPKPMEFELKSILEMVDEEAILSAELYEFCRWVADYYFAPLGEVIRAACPLAFTTSSRQFVSIGPKGKRRLEEVNKSKRADLLFESLQREPLDLRMLRWLMEKGRAGLQSFRKAFDDPSAPAVIQTLRTGGEILVQTEVTKQRMKARTETVVRLSSAPEEAGSTRKLSPGQEKVLTFLQELESDISLRHLTERLKVSPSSVLTLVKRGRVILDQAPLGRVPFERAAPSSPEPVIPVTLPFVLTRDQEKALRAVEDAVQEGRFTTLLLFGVTASGKTEIYLRAIERVLREGGSALMLVPEIALTPATARAFAVRFSGHVAILHSGLSEGERYDEWWRIKNSQARVVVGTRSAIFAPLENLKLIVVDEEHDGSYKQQESPRYQGRDMAIVRAKQNNAVALLGSATPSMESFYNAQQGKYRLITLKNRVESRALPKVDVVDMRREFQESKKGEMLSRGLVEAMESRLRSEEQVMVLLNRRGFASFVLCRACGVTRQCPHCSITMTYHKRRHTMLCHYCGAFADVPKVCWQCGSEHLHFVGAGTEQIEEKLRQHFPPARIARLDRDSVQGRGGYQKILGEFREGMTDILVGTQMIAKGHDFPRVTLVGVLNADGALAFPDFRAAERTFQLLTQVAGRAGRGDAPGDVLLQAYYPEHYAIRFAARQDFMEFYNKEIHFRRMMHYPPFGQLALVGIRHSDFNAAMKLAKGLGDHLRAQASPEVRILGPAVAPLARLKNEYRWQMLLKAARRSSLKVMIDRCLRYCEEKKISEPNILIDVDPTNMM